MLGGTNMFGGCCEAMLGECLWIVCLANELGGCV